MKIKHMISTIFFGLLVCSEGLYASEPAKEGTLTVTVTPGASWKTERDPQFAVWVEKADGTYVTTLFVTQRAAKKNWLFAPKGGRPESLPVWYHAVGSASVVMKAQPASGGTDALTSATPGAAGDVSKTARLSAGEVYVIKVEVNHSFDYNESWPKKAKKGSVQYSGVNGQPSVVYAGTLDVWSAGTEADYAAVQTALAPVGTGSVDGRDGNLHDDLGKLTTALQIVAKAEASWSAAE